jgi:hypothetical protein
MSEPSQKSPEQLRANIERTRKELGETVDALAQKADVRNQVRDDPLPLAAGIGAALVALWLMRRR